MRPETLHPQGGQNDNHCDAPGLISECHAQNHLLEVEARRAPGPTWDTVRYMIAQIQYGGRITDDFDNLLMRTYAAKFFHQGVLAANYTLYRAEKGPTCYQVPVATEIEMFRKVCSSLAAWGA